MALKDIDIYHRKMIYGAKANIARAKTSEEKELFTRMARAYRASAKQLKERT